MFGVIIGSEQVPLDVSDIWAGWEEFCVFYKWIVRFLSEGIMLRRKKSTDSRLPTLE